MIEIGDSDYRVEDGTIDLHLRLHESQAERIAQQCPEAASGPEAVRMLLEEALQKREGRVTPATIEAATRRATEPIHQDLGELKALLERSVDADGEFSL